MTSRFFLNEDQNISDIEKQFFNSINAENNIFSAFISLGDLKLHIMWHYNIKPFQCEEQGCTWSFLTQAKLNRHIKSHLKVTS